MKLIKLKKVLCLLGALIYILPAAFSGVSAYSGGTQSNEVKLIPGGVPFGVKLYSEGVLVVGTEEILFENKKVCPAKEAGIIIGDIIISVDGKRVSGASEVSSIVAESNGKPLCFEIVRKEDTVKIEVTPVMSDDGRYKTGIIIRDSTVGIGTVTYVNPTENSFAGLGHGICDTATGDLVKLWKGAVVNAEISGVIKGKSGAPGELKGYFSSGKIGALFGNTDCGVYGVFSEYPKGLTTEETLPATSAEICEGEAELLCTVDFSGIKSYKVKIAEIDHSGKNVKNFAIIVTDDELLDKTGGIVQGMSGSPVIQNGKLVGAVTHVLVNDPTRGYGIFIENMLAEAEGIK